jgi:sodium transport system permease protein
MGPNGRPKVQSGLAAIILKELRRFFTDRRMVLTTIILPGLMIYLLYTLIGGAVGSLTSVDNTKSIYVVNLPDSLKAQISTAGLNFEASDNSQVDALKQQVTDKDADLLVVFPADFDAQVNAQLAAVSSDHGGGNVTDSTSTSNGNANGNANGSTAAATTSNPPQIAVYYNSVSTSSTQQFSAVTQFLDSYKNSLAPLFSVNDPGQDGTSFDLASAKDSSGFVFSMMLPMLILIFLFTSCMSIGPESIAGEKERGTIATLLVTPLKRWQLALGKIVSLSCIALLGGLSSFIGVMLSLPKLMNSGSTVGTSSLTIYSVSDYLLLLGVILSTVLVFVGLISMLSALARGVREASTYVMPLMIVVALVGATGMFSQTATSNLMYYLIPAYNSVQSMIGIFSFAASPLHIAITIGVNVIIAGICVIGLTRMFESERIVFSR